MNNLDWDDLYSDYSSRFIDEDDRYENVKGDVEDLITELYGNLKSGLDLMEIHNLMSRLAGEMNLYIPQDNLTIERIA